MTGASARRKVILIITVMATFAAILSIMGSAYGLYYDMVLDYGFTFALIMGILGGIFIEGVKYVSIAMFFAWGDSLLVRGLGVGLMIFIMPIAIALHYKGADNMQRTKSIEVIDQVQKRNAKLAMMEQQRKNKITDIANSIVHNGTIADDAIAMKTLANINKYSNSLLSQGRISQMDMMQINEVKRASKKRAASLKIILPLLEVLSIFGMIGALLKSMSVSTGVKKVVAKKQLMTETDAVIEMMKPKQEDNSFIDAVLDTMDKVHREKTKVLKRKITQTQPTLSNDTNPKIAYSPTPEKVNYLIDNQGEQFAYYKGYLVFVEEENGYILDIYKAPALSNGFDLQQTNVKTVGEIDSPYCEDNFIEFVDNKLVQTSSKTSQQTSSAKTEQSPQNGLGTSFSTSSETSSNTLDLMLFGATDREIITTLWKQGDVQPDDKLASKAVVLRETKIKPTKYSTFMNELENREFAYNIQGKGWYAKVPLKNKVSVE